MIICKAIANKIMPNILVITEIPISPNFSITIDQYLIAIYTTTAPTNAATTSCRVT